MNRDDIFTAMLISFDDLVPTLTEIIAEEISEGALPAFIDPSLQEAPFRCGRLPFPEMSMRYAAVERTTEAWSYHVCVLNYHFVRHRLILSPSR